MSLWKIQGLALLHILITVTCAYTSYSSCFLHSSSIHGKTLHFTRKSYSRTSRSKRTTAPRPALMPWTVCLQSLTASSTTRSMDELFTTNHTIQNENKSYDDDDDDNRLMRVTLEDNQNHHSAAAAAAAAILSLPTYADMELPTTTTTTTTAIEILNHNFESTTASGVTLSSFSTKYVMNTILLIACFTFASYTIFNVDAGMTRGWTLEEKAMRIPLDNWASYESSLNTQPVITKTMINVIIYLLGDWASQTIFVKKNIIDFDAMRTLRNGFIGLCFGPLVHLYYEFSDTILPVEVGINRLYKICMDQTIYLAVKCSIYIMAVNILSGESLQTGQRKIQDKLQGIMFTAWKFWPLVHLITYNVIPARHRILWVNCVDLVWNAILSLRTNSNTTTTHVDETRSMEDQEHQNNTQQKFEIRNTKNISMRIRHILQELQYNDDCCV